MPKRKAVLCAGNAPGSAPRLGESDGVFGSRWEDRRLEMVARHGVGLRREERDEWEQWFAAATADLPVIDVEVVERLEAGGVVLELVVSHRYSASMSRKIVSIWSGSVFRRPPHFDVATGTRMWRSAFTSTSRERVVREGRGWLDLAVWLVERESDPAVQLGSPRRNDG